MKSSLEEIASEIDINQKTGIFHIPESIRNCVYITHFIEQIKPGEEHPIVVAEEKYTRQSVIQKIGEGKGYHLSLKFVSELLEYQLLRLHPRKPGQRVVALDNLSFAQVISFVYQVPIETVLIPESYFSSEEFKSKGYKERLKVLFNAFTGTSWFERFKLKFKRRKINQKYTPWHNISLDDLPDLLCTSPYEPNDSKGNLTKLVNAGFIVPRTKFIKNSQKNFVDNDALIELASLVTGRSHEELTNEDDYIEYIAREFIQKRLIPYSKEVGIDLRKTVSLSTARKRTGFISKYLCKLFGITPRTKNFFYSRHVRFPSINLLLYELKNTKRHSLSRDEIAELFGVNDIDCERCGLYIGRKGNYSTLQRVFPFYDKVTEVVKDILTREPLILNPQSQNYKQGEDEHDKKEEEFPSDPNSKTKTYEQIIKESQRIQRHLDRIALKRHKPTYLS
jgi:hypothetical protein